jgi:CheY-like chemotaxis protein
MPFQAQKRQEKSGDAAISDYIIDQNKSLRDLQENGVKNVALSKQTEDKETAILIVDDHPEIRYYIRQILEDNYKVIEASHGLEAMEVLGNMKVDLIVTDLMMPWMDGFELIEAINYNEDYNKIPLLVVSARISGSDKEKVLYKGINEYLQKPFSKKELILRIENLLKLKEKYTEDSKGNVFSSLVKDNLADVEKDILKKLENEVTERIDDPNLSVLSLTEAMAASERQVYRLVKKLTGLTPYEYIMEVRMQYADYLIRKNKVKNASEAARSVGYKNVTVFSKQYQKRFGSKPADVLK